MNWGGVTIDAKREHLVVVHTHASRPHPADAPRRGRHDEREGLRLPNFGFEPMKGTPYAVQRQLLLSPVRRALQSAALGQLTRSISRRARSAGRCRSALCATSRRSPSGWIFGRLRLPNLGGPITTASGLTFIGATMDGYLRAFDVGDGRGALEGASARRRPRDADDLSARARRTAVRRDRRRRPHALGSKPGDVLVAYALPR